MKKLFYLLVMVCALSLNAQKIIVFEITSIHEKIGENGKPINKYLSGSLVFEGNTLVIDYENFQEKYFVFNMEVDSSDAFFNLTSSNHIGHEIVANLYWSEKFDSPAFIMIDKELRTGLSTHTLYILKR